MSSALLASVSASATAKYCFASKPTVAHSGKRLPSFIPVAASRDMANQSYPQTVNLDEAKSKAAELQSQQSKARDGVTKPNDEASKARVSFDEFLQRYRYLHACMQQRAIIAKCQQSHSLPLCDAMLVPTSDFCF